MMRPRGLHRKFAKTWKEKDLSARQYLLEWNLLPSSPGRKQFVHADVSQ